MRTHDDLTRELDELRSAVRALLAHGEGIHKERLHEANRTRQSLGREYSASWGAARAQGREVLGLPFLPVSTPSSRYYTTTEHIPAPHEKQQSIDLRADIVGQEFDNFFKDRAA